MYTFKKSIANPLLKSGAKYITIFNTLFINLAPPFLKVEKIYNQIVKIWLSASLTTFSKGGKGGII